MDVTGWTGAARGEAMLQALREHAGDLRHAGDAHEHSGAESVRTARYRGHDIVIRTSYHITVDGRPLPITAAVDNAGRVHYHGLPTRDFESVVDLVEDAIDAFPDDFPHRPGDGAPHPDHPTTDTPHEHEH